MNETTPVDRRPWWIAGAAVAAVLAVVVAIALFTGGGGDGGDAGEDAASGDDGVTTAVTASAGTVEGPATSDPSATPAASVPGDTAPAGSTAPSSPASTTPEPVVTVPVITGSLDTVAVDTVVPAAPVAMDDVADAGTGMTFRVEQLEAVQGEAAGPGEIAAPAVRVTIVATNGGTQPVLMESVVVDLVTGDDAASSPPLSGPGVDRFSGELAPGASATGIYVFDVPIDRRDRVSILVSYLASVSPVVFEGAAPAV